MEPSKDSSESSECSPRSTPPPKSSEDNLKISLNQVIGPELEGILSTEKVEQGNIYVLYLSLISMYQNL